MTPEERHYYEKQSGPTKPNPMMRPMKMNDERFQDAKHKARIRQESTIEALSDNSDKIEYVSDEKFKKALAEVLKTMPNLPSYSRTTDQSASLAAELCMFLNDFPSLRLGTVLATVIPEDRSFMFRVWDEEVIRRLHLFRDFMDGPNTSIDWVGYLEEHS